MSTYDSKGYAPDEREENVGGTATDCPDMPCPDMPELQKAESEGINEPSSINSDLQVEMPEYDPDEQMRHALGDMMHLSTPVLDMVRVILTLPAFIVAKLLLHPIFLYSMGMAALDKLIAGQLDMGEVMDLANLYIFPFGLAAATNGVTGAIEHIEKEATESSIREELLKIFKDEGLTIHSYNREGSIPDYLIGHSHLFNDYNGSVGGDLINIHYRGHAISCCNIALTQPHTPALDLDALLGRNSGQSAPSNRNSGQNTSSGRNSGQSAPSNGNSGQAAATASSGRNSETETYIDQYKEDDIEAAARYSIKKGQDVVFYGSVFVFMPGPDIEGRISLEAAEPIEYLRNLKSMDETDILTNLVRTQDKKDVFDFNHRIREVGIGDASEADRVFTQRIKDMVLQLELDMHAPVEVYADKNMVCLTIQKKAFDFDNTHFSSDIDRESRKELENTLIVKVNNFRKILDIMMGPEEDEYTELFGVTTEQRSSVYTPIMNPIRPRAIPNDEEISAYIDDLVEYSLEVYHFFLQRSAYFQRECADLKWLSKRFLTKLYSNEVQTKFEELISTDSGKEFVNSLTEIITDHFRELWNASGNYSVKNINRKINRNNSETIKIDISVYPPIREWNSKKGTDRLAALMKKHLDRFNHFQKVINDAEEQRAFLEIFKEKLSTAYVLKYDVEHIYTITMSLLKNDCYGFEPNEWSEFYKWYLGLLNSNMTVNEEKFTL